MKILIVATGLKTKAGTYTVLKNICPLLMKKNEITILTNDEGEIDILCNNQIKLKSWSFPLPHYRFMPGLFDLIKSKTLNNYDIIHVFEYPLFATDYLVLKKRKITPPIIISMHGTLHQFSGFPLNFFKKIHNAIMLRFSERVNGFIASTQAEKKHIAEYGIRAEKIQVLHLGVNIPTIKLERTDEKFILYLGRLSITKNLELLIEAFSLCKTTNVNLIIAGPDFGMKQKLEKLVQAHNLGKRVFFKGRVSEEEKLKLLSEATIFVHPSLEDVFSLALIEAAAVGVPCVAFDVEANSEILDDMVTGKIVKKTDVSSLANALDSLLNDKNLLEQISYNAKKIIPQKFNWENTVNILEKYYIEITTNAKSKH